MQRLIIDIEVNNFLEIIKKRKGRISAFFAKHLIREQTIRNEVEQRVVQEIKKGIETHLQLKLQQEEIQATINISVESGDNLEK